MVLAGLVVGGPRARDDRVRLPHNPWFHFSQPGYCRRLCSGLMSFQRMDDAAFLGALRATSKANIRYGATDRYTHHARRRLQQSVKLDAEVTIRRRQVDPQLRTVGGAQRNVEECQ